MTNILVCGGRDFTDYDRVKRVLNLLRMEYGDFTIISGMAKGADSLGARYADENNLPLEKYPALWDVHGRAAGPIRNQLMLDDGEPDLIVAFPGGKGTAHMIKIAKKAGVPVIEVPQ